MIAPAKPLGLTGRLARLSRDVAEALGCRRWVSVLVSPGAHPAVHLDGRELPVELGTAVLSASGVPGGSSSDGSAGLVRSADLGRGATTLRTIMEEHGVEALWVVSLAGPGRTAGALCFEARASGAPPAWLTSDDPFWAVLSMAAEEARTRALSASLRVASGVPSPRLEQGSAALLCADLEHRVLFASPGAGGILGCAVDPYEVLDREAAITATLHGASPDEPALAWRELPPPSKAGSRPVEVAILPPRGPSPASAPARVALVLDTGGSGTPPGLRDQIASLADELDVRLEGHRTLLEAMEAHRETRGGKLFQELRGTATASLRDTIEAAERTRALLGRGEGGADLNALLQDLSEEVERGLEIRSVRVFRFLPPELPRVAADPFMLRRVFRALYEVSSAALERGGGAVTFRTWEEDGYVYGSIADDGPGLSDEDMAALYSRSDDAGHGALAPAREIVARLGGRIEVESRPGLWTRFTVLLPTRPSLKQSPKVHDLPASIQVDGDRDGGLQVLVVDDNTQLRSVVKRFLERRGHSVTEAGDGNEALELLGEADFDRLLVDLNMPGKCGKELYRDLEGVAPRLQERTIFMSGEFHEGAVDEFVAASGRPAVHKPFDLVEMARTVEA